MPRVKVHLFRGAPGFQRLLACSAMALSAAGLVIPSTAQASDRSAAASARIPDWSGSRYRANSFDARFYSGLGGCLASRWPARAQALMATLPDSESQKQAIATLLGGADQCVFSGRVKLRMHRLRGAVAEALIKQGRVLPKGASWLAADETSTALGRKLLAAYAGRTLNPQHRSDLLGRRVAYCTVQKSPGLVADLLQRPAGFRNEPASLKRLDPTLAGCLPGNLTLNLGLSSMRAYLAEALYWSLSLKGSSDA